jgi:dihydrofolate synthase/folylpolyglutamate synthase
MAAPGVGIQLGLERIRACLSALGDPHCTFPVLHVAGTNGKGSTCALLEAALLRACAAPVGKFVSPYLREPRDAVSINGAPVKARSWAAALAAVAAAAPPGLTPFEAWTAAAFLLFSRARVGVAVVEVGVGGGGDATNVVPPPLAALVTSISEDHVELLGPTLAHIAAHKGGIFKAGGGAALSAPGQAPEVLAALAAAAGAAALPLTVVPPLPRAPCGALRAPGGAPLPLGLAGAFQAGNAALAFAALRHCAAVWPALGGAGGEALIAAAWEGAAWAGRMEPVALRGLAFTLDGGHNAGALGAVGRELGARAAALGAPGGAPVPVALLLACGASRDAARNAALLLGGVAQGAAPRGAALRVCVFAVPFSTPEGMPWAAAHPPAVVAAAAAAAAPGVEARACASLAEALDAVAADSALASDGALRAICGSLYLVSDVHRGFLGGAPEGEWDGWE